MHKFAAKDWNCKSSVKESGSFPLLTQSKKSNTSNNKNYNITQFAWNLSLPLSASPLQQHV